MDFDFKKSAGCKTDEKWLADHGFTLGEKNEEWPDGLYHPEYILYNSQGERLCSIISMYSCALSHVIEFLYKNGHVPLNEEIKHEWKSGRVEMIRERLKNANTTINQDH